MKFSETIKGHVESMTCPVHDIHPIIEQDWDGIKVIACCSDFHNACLEQAENLMTTMDKPSSIENP